jgi:hypothetical protein
VLVEHDGSFLIGPPSCHFYQKGASPGSLNIDSYLTGPPALLSTTFLAFVRAFPR